MSTNETWVSRLRHDSDAMYQEWRDELITKLNLLTLLVADETNITPGAGARPASSSEGGYAVYHLNDPLHGTAPIYIRFGFGSQSSNTNPSLRVTVGTSTNGSGVLGGTALSTIGTINGNAADLTDSGRASFLSCVDGFFGMSWKQGISIREGSFFLMRTVDSGGAPTATGAIARWGAGTASQFGKHQAFRFASPAAAYTAQTSSLESAMFGFFPTAQPSSAVGADLQAAVGYTVTPRAEPIVGVIGVIPGEIPNGTTFTCTPIGTTARTYIALTNAAGPFGPGTPGIVDGMPKFAMLWE